MYLIKLVIRSNILQVKEVALRIVLIIILEKSIDIILYLLKKILTFLKIIILIKSVVNKNKNEYYYNKFLEKGSYKDKSDTQYFQINIYIL